jgi:ribulose kinase
LKRTLADRLLELDGSMKGDDGAEVLLPPEEWKALVVAAQDESDKAIDARHAAGGERDQEKAVATYAGFVADALGLEMEDDPDALLQGIREFARLAERTRDDLIEARRELARRRQEDSAPSGAAEDAKPKPKRTRKKQLTGEESAELAAKFRRQREELPTQVDLVDAVEAQ